MTENTGQRAPDERAATIPVLEFNIASPPLYSPTMHVFESNTLSHEHTIAQLSPPGQITKNLRHIHGNSSPSPLLP